MEGDDGENASRLQDIKHVSEGRVQHVHLSIDRNPECLKCFPGRMLLPPCLGRNRIADNFGELKGCPDGFHLAFPHNSGSNPRCEPLFTVFVQNPLQISLRKRIDQVSGRRTVLAHPHIQRCIVVKRKSPFRGIQLMGADAEIGQNTGQRRYTALFYYRFYIGKIIMDYRDAGISSDPLGHNGYGIRILIHTDQPAFGSQPPQDFP